jgi:SOS-response transcriptional repressor LexA
MPKTIGQRIKTAREAARMTQKQLSDASGIPQGSISEYENDRSEISAFRLGSIALALKVPMATLDPRLADLPGGDQIQDQDVPYDVRSLGVPGWRDVPVLGAAAAAGYEPAVEPLDDWLTGFGEETDTWPAEQVGENYFCLRVQGDSMSPEFPDGTILLVAAGEYPQRGDLVVARLADHGEVVVKLYQRHNNVIELLSEHPRGKNFAIDLKAEPGRLVWMWPVVQARIDLRRRRWERHRG